MPTMDYDHFEVADLDYVYAVAAFPGDANKQRNYVELSNMKYYAATCEDNFREMVSKYPDIAIGLMQYINDGGRTNFESEFQESFNRSTMVGDMLLAHYIIDMHHPEIKMSMNKLLYLFSSLKPKGFPTSASGLRNYWREYSCKPPIVSASRKLRPPVS